MTHRIFTRRRLLALALASALLPGAVLANATGGTFAVGAGTITNAGNTVNVGVSTAVSQVSVINWANFNIANGETVNFNNGTNQSLAVVNVDNQGAVTHLAGAINAPAVNGKNTTVLVLNPYGVSIDSTAVINTSGGFGVGNGTVGPNTNAPAGTIAVNLTGGYVQTDVNAQGQHTTGNTPVDAAGNGYGRLTRATGASITAGDTQGASVGLAFMGAPLTGGASLPALYGSGRYFFYPDEPVASYPIMGGFLGTFYLHGISLAGSNATYDFNGQYQFGLLLSQTWDTNDTGDIFFVGNHSFQQSFGPGTLNLGNATFTTDATGGGFYIGTSSIQGGNFAIPVAVPPPTGGFNLPNGFQMTVVGDSDGTNWVSNGQYDGLRTTNGTFYLGVSGTLSNATFAFGPKTWLPSITAKNLTNVSVNSQSASLPTDTTVNTDYLSAAGGTAQNITYNGQSANVSVSANTINGANLTTNGQFTIYAFDGGTGVNATANGSSAGGSMLVAYSNAITNSTLTANALQVQLYGAGPNTNLNLYALNGNLTVTAAGASTGTWSVSQDANLNLFNSLGAVNLASGGNVTVQAGGSVDGSWSVAGNATVYANTYAPTWSLSTGGNANLTGYTSVGGFVSTDTLTLAGPLASGLTAYINHLSAKGVNFQGSYVDTLDSAAPVGTIDTSTFILDNGGKLDSGAITNSKISATTGDLALVNSVGGAVSLSGSTVTAPGTVSITGTDLSFTNATTVTGNRITGDATGTVVVDSTSALRVANPTDANTNNTIYLNGGSGSQVEGSANVQASGHNWLTNGVSVANGATVLNAPEIGEGTAPYGIELSGKLDIQGVLYAGDGHAVAPPPPPPPPPPVIDPPAPPAPPAPPPFVAPQVVVARLLPAPVSDWTWQGSLLLDPVATPATAPTTVHQDQ